MIFSWVFLLNLALVACSSSSSQPLRSRITTSSVVAESVPISLDEDRLKLYEDIKQVASSQRAKICFADYEIKNWPEFVPPNYVNWDEQAVKDLREAIPRMIFKRRSVSIDGGTEYTNNRKRLLNLLTERFNEQIGNRGKQLRINWSRYHIKFWPRGVPIPAREWDSRKLLLIYRHLTKIEFEEVKVGEQRTILYSDGHSEVDSATRNKSERSMKRKYHPKRKGRKRRRHVAYEESDSECSSEPQQKVSRSESADKSSESEEDEDRNNVNQSYENENDESDFFDSFDDQEAIPDLLGDEIESSGSEIDASGNEPKVMEDFESYIKLITPVSTADIEDTEPTQDSHRIYNGCDDIIKFEEEALQSYDPTNDYFFALSTDN